MTFCGRIVTVVSSANKPIFLLFEIDQKAITFLFCFLKCICMECQLVSGGIIKNSKPVTPEKLDKHLFSGWRGIQVYFTIAQNSVMQFHLVFVSCRQPLLTPFSCIFHIQIGQVQPMSVSRKAMGHYSTPPSLMPAGLKVFKRPWILLLASPNPAWRRKVAVQQNQSLSLNQPSQNKNNKK